MEYHNPSDLVKDLRFGDEAKSGIINGVKKLSDAVQSTLGASGQCVIYEDGMGRPLVTKDGVTVAESVVLLDPIENIGASLIKEAAKNTVRDAGDGTTTSTILARYLLEGMQESKAPFREIRRDIEKGVEEVNTYIDSVSIPVTDETLIDVAVISCNNDAKLGGIIGEAFNKVGTDGVVLVEDSETNETYTDIIDGCQFGSGLKSQYLATNKDAHTAELDKPLILITSSPIASIRKIQKVLEYVVNKERSLLIIGEVEPAAMKSLLTNKVKGNLKVNFVDAVGFGSTKEDAMEDLAILTGAKVINESLGDDMDMISIDMLGEVLKSVTDEKTTILTINKDKVDITERIETVKKAIEDESNGFIKTKLQERLAVLAGKVGVIYIGADSAVELKEKKDRVDDAVHAVKAAVKGGIVSGGGVVLKDAALTLNKTIEGYNILAKAMLTPMIIICDNAGLELPDPDKVGEGWGMNAISGKVENMIDSKIIDPAFVTKTALKNAVSVAITINSAGCVINNIRA